MIRREMEKRYPGVSHIWQAHEPGRSPAGRAKFQQMEYTEAKKRTNKWLCGVFSETVLHKLELSHADSMSLTETNKKETNTRQVFDMG